MQLPHSTTMRYEAMLLAGACAVALGKKTVINKIKSSLKINILVMVCLIAVLADPLMTSAALAPAEEIISADNSATAAISEGVEEDKVPEVPAEPARKLKTYRVVVTQYSRADSCHNIRNGKCLMASGKEVYVGAVACPKFLKLGTVITLHDQEYTCEDRYANWLDGRRGLPTIDVFVESNPRGRYTTSISIES